MDWPLWQVLSVIENKMLREPFFVGLTAQQKRQD
jgi:hypothetical protein